MSIEREQNRNKRTEPREYPCIAYLTQDELDVLYIISDYIKQTPETVTSFAVERLLSAFKPIAYAMRIMSDVEKLIEGSKHMQKANGENPCLLDSRYKKIVESVQELDMSGLADKLNQVYDFVNLANSEEEVPEDKSTGEIIDDILNGFQTWQKREKKKKKEKDDKDDNNPRSKA